MDWQQQQHQQQRFDAHAKMLENRTSSRSWSGRIITADEGFVPPNRMSSIVAELNN